MVSVLFDANIPHQVAAAMKAFGCQAYQVAKAPGLRQDSKDPEVIRWCADRDVVLVTWDHKMRRTNQYLPLIRKTGVSIAFFRPPSKAGWTAKEWFRQVVKRMDDIEHAFSHQSPRCRFYPQRGSPKDYDL